MKNSFQGDWTVVDTLFNPLSPPKKLQKKVGTKIRICLSFLLSPLFVVGQGGAVPGPDAERDLRRRGRRLLLAGGAKRSRGEPPNSDQHQEQQQAVGGRGRGGGVGIARSVDGDHQESRARRIQRKGRIR